MWFYCSSCDISLLTNKKGLIWSRSIILQVKPFYGFLYVQYCQGRLWEFLCDALSTVYMEICLTIGKCIWLIVRFNTFSYGAHLSKRYCYLILQNRYSLGKISTHFQFINCSKHRRSFNAINVANIILSYNYLTLNSTPIPK